MSRLVPLLLLVLTACATGPAVYRQAAPAMVPMRPPAVRPVVNVPHFPTPGATPTGTGLYHPEGATRDMPRSPNTRVLPPTKEPGLWAADEIRASGASTPPEIAGVPIVLPKDRLGRQPAPNMCVWTVRDMLTDKQKLVLAALNDAQRRCAVASLYHQCVKMSDAESREINYHHALMMYRAKHTRRKPMPETGPSEDERNGKALVEAWCGGGIGAGHDVVKDHGARLGKSIAESK